MTTVYHPPPPNSHATPVIMESLSCITSPLAVSVQQSQLAKSDTNGFLPSNSRIPILSRLAMQRQNPSFISQPRPPPRVEHSQSANDVPLTKRQRARLRRRMVIVDVLHRPSPWTRHHSTTAIAGAISKLDETPEQQPEERQIEALSSRQFLPFGGIGNDGMSSTPEQARTTASNVRALSFTVAQCFLPFGGKPKQRRRRKKRKKRTTTEKTTGTLPVCCQHFIFLSLDGTKTVCPPPPTMKRHPFLALATTGTSLLVDGTMMACPPCGRCRC